MKATVLVEATGSATIPAAILEALRIGPGVEVVVEATPEGILMRPARRMEIEDYTEECIAELTSDEAALGMLFSNRPARD